MNFDVRYHVAGKIKAPAGWLHPSSNTETHELIWCTGGAIYIGQGFDRFVLRAGDAVILRSGERRYGFRECDKPSDFYWAHFSGSLGTLPERSLPDAKRMTRLFDELIMYSRTPEFDDDACSCALSLIMFEIMRAGAADKNSPQAKIFAICEWIRQNGGGTLRVSDVAEHFNYNEDYITRLFKAHYSEGIKAYIDAVRIKRIRELLLCTNMKIKDVAEVCGFSDSKSFQKFFKYHENISAATFRELYFGAPKRGGRKSAAEEESESAGESETETESESESGNIE